jgi:hypothetical protein
VYIIRIPIWIWKQNIILILRRGQRLLTTLAGSRCKSEINVKAKTRVTKKLFGSTTLVEE